MKLRRIAAVLVVLGALVLAAAAAVRHYLPPERLAAALAGQVRQSTGRELVIGSAELRLFPRPAVILGDLGLRNAAWGSQPWMARVGRAEAEMTWRSLLRGEIGITRISLAEATLLLETDSSGNGNWVMAPPTSGPANLSWLTGFQVGELSLRPLKFSYRDGASGETAELLLHQAALDIPAAPQPIRLRGEGTYSGAGFAIEGSVGALATLLERKRPYPVTLSATTGESRLELRGEAEQPLQLGGLGFELLAQGPKLADLEVLLPAIIGSWLRDRQRQGHDLPSLAYRLGWRLTGSWNALSISALDATVGDSARMEFRARGSLELRQSATGPLRVSDMNLELAARGQEIRDFLALAGESVPPAGSYEMSARVSGPEEAPALSDIAIEVGSPERGKFIARGEIRQARKLEGMDLRVTAGAARPWRLGEAASSPQLPPFRFQARLRDRPGGYALDGLGLEVAGSKLAATMNAARSNGRLRISGRAATPLIDLARVMDLAAPAGGAAARDAAPKIGSPLLLRLADMDLDVQVGKLVLRDRRVLTAISGRLVLSREGLAIRSGRLTAAGSEVGVEGTVADPLLGTGIDLRLAVRGNELADVAGFAGRRLPPVGPYRASARARGSLAALGLTEIEARAGKAGQAQLQARGSIADASKGEGLDLALVLDVSDPAFPSRLAGRALPRLPPLRLSAQVTDAGGQYALDDLRLSLGRSALQGRLTLATAGPRPRIGATLKGALLDLSEIRPPAGARPPGNPLDAADIEADIRLERLVLPGKQALGPVSGRIAVSAGKLELHQLAVAAGGASAVVDGTVADVLKPAGLDLAVNAEVKDTAGLAVLLDTDLPRLPPFKASARLSGGSEAFTLSGLKLAFAATTVSGELSAAREATRFRVRATLASPVLDTTEFFAEKEPEPKAARAPRERVFSGDPLQLGLLRAADANLDLKVETLRFRKLPPLGPMAAHLVLSGGRLQAGPLRIEGPKGGHMEASARVDARPGRKPGLELRMEGRSIDMGGALSQIDERITVTGGTTDFRLQLSSRGESQQALMAAMDGSVWIRMGPARIHHLSFDPGTGIFQRVFDLLTPFRKTDTDTDLKCLAVRVPIAAGVITADRGIAAETDKYNVVASGTVDLGTEALAMVAVPSASQGLALGTDRLVRGVRIGGTLANPRISLETTGAAESLASIYADVATAGGWLLADALLKKARADPNPCATALAEKR